MHIAPGGVAILDLRLLGPFSAKFAGAELQLLQSSRKACALLAFVALQPGFTAGREVLADLLWGGRCEEDARHSLRQCLAELKKEFEPVAPGFLKVDRQSVALDAAMVSVDVHTADRFDPVIGGDELDAVVRLFRGEFLDRLDINSDSFVHWVAGERQRLRGRRAQIYKSAVAFWSSIGEHNKVIDAAERLIALDPLREDWQRLLIRLYCSNYGRGHALKHARSVVEMLKRELDVEPETETCTLIEQVKAGTVGRQPERNARRFAEASQLLPAE